MLSASNLTIKYNEVLFDNISFSLGNKEKVALVGLNGCGKSTLMKILAGKESADRGSVNLSDEKIGYLPQEFEFSAERYLGEYFEEIQENYWVPQYEINKFLNKLEFGDWDEFDLMSTFSPGQKMKLYLLKLLVQKPTILLLDEPTNHLDIYGIIWFEEFINRFNGIAIIISHDREFLNNVTDHVLEIDEKTLYQFEGNYDDYLIQKEIQIEERQKQFHIQEQRRKKLETLLENTRKIRDAKKRGKAVKAAKKRMEREVLSKEIDEYKRIKLDKMNLDSNIHSRKRILEINDLSFRYSGTEEYLLKNADLKIYGQEKIWLYGPNGIGKSTLIKILNGKLEPSDGDYRWGENLNIRYFSQEQHHLPLEKKLIDYFIESTGINFYKAGGVLEEFLFPRSIQEYKIKQLSPGQRARLTFAIFSTEQNDCLILDEPTNHLDIQTKSVIEESLKKFEGAMILISHDRAFSKAIEPDRIITIENKQIVEK